MDLSAISAGGSLAENWAAVSGALNPVLYFLGATAAIRCALGFKNFFDGGFEASLGKPIMMLYFAAMGLSLPSFMNSTAERLVSEKAEKLAVEAVAVSPINFEKFQEDAGPADSARRDIYKEERERRDAYRKRLNDVVGWTGVGRRLSPPEGEMDAPNHRTAKNGPYRRREVKDSPVMAGTTAALNPTENPVVKAPEAKPASEAASHALVAANAAMKVGHRATPVESPSKAGSEDLNHDRGDLAAMEPVEFEAFQKDRRQEEQERRDAYKKGFNDAVGWAGEGKQAGQPSDKMASQNYARADGSPSLSGGVKDSMAIAGGKDEAHAVSSLGAQGHEPKPKSEAANPPAVAASGASKSERLATPEEARSSADAKALLEAAIGITIALLAGGVAWLSGRARRARAENRQDLPEVDFPSSPHLGALEVSDLGAVGKRRAKTH